MKVKVKQRSDQPVLTQECIFFDSCCGACEWCKTNNYSEACVPLLQKRIEQLGERVKLEQKWNDHVMRQRTVLKAMEYEFWLLGEPPKILFWEWLAWRKAEPKMEG